MRSGQSKGVVAAGHEQTAHAAAEILRRGGNAVDAVIAGVFASLIAEPVLTGLFGGGLLSVRQPDGGCSTLDCFARMPGLGVELSPAALDFESVFIDFGPARQEFHIGRGSAAVPGTLRGLFEAHRRWGSLALEALVEPAVHLAHTGVPLTRQMAFIFSLLEPILTRTAGSRALFAPHGELLAAGQPHHNPDLGDLVERLAREGLEGETGRALRAALVELCAPPHGLLTAADLYASGPVTRQPLHVSYRQVDVILPPAPTMGGPLVALGLAMLERAPVIDPDTTDGLAWMAEIQHCMTEARVEEPERFLAGDALEALWQALVAVREGLLAPGGTTHISVIDGSGMAAAMTHSNGEGCGWVIPGTGVMMNNFLGESDINPAGFHRLPAGADIMTMMCPTIAQRGDECWVLGSGGSNRIRTAILQVLHSLLARGMSAEAAVGAPRMHVEKGVLNVERAGRSPGWIAELAPLADEIVSFDDFNMFFGGVHLVHSGPDGFDGAGDARRGGVLVRL